MAFQILIQVVETENHIREIPDTVRNVQFGDNSAVIRDFGDETVCIRQSKKIDGGAVRQLAKAGFLNIRFHLLLALSGVANRLAS
jgi:hypothetical protein